jgi:putative spermidine/putrescine transport system permease protein
MVGSPPAIADTARRSRVRAGRGALFWRFPGLATLGLLAPPALWFVALYLAALAAMLVTSFWQVDPLSGDLVRQFTLANFQDILADRTYRVIAGRTALIAAAVTLTDAVLAFPFAWFMARIAGRRLRAALLALVMIPLWSSYLARVYAWRLILAHDGILNWALRHLGLGPQAIDYSNWAMWIVFSYLWLPFMILPVYAALERIPASLLEASADLGARGWRTLRRVVLPLALPGLVAGSVFTFSLTLGDYVSPMLVGGPGSDFIGNVVYANVGVANNIPFAAAYATLPMLVMALFLLAARACGAFQAL